MSEQNADIEARTSVDDLVGAGKAIAPFSKVAADMLRLMCGPFANEIGLAGASLAQYFRMRLERILERAKKKLDEQGQIPQEVSPQVLVPMLQAASLEDDESMKERWAQLIASAASGAFDTHPAFASILSQLTPDEARDLDRMAPNLNSECGCHLEYESRNEHYKRGFNNWIRLGIVEIAEPAATPGFDFEVRYDHTVDGLPQPTKCYRLTPLGRDFLAACGVPTKTYS